MTQMSRMVCAVQGDIDKHESWINMNVFYVIPVAPGKSAVLFSGFFTAHGAKKMPLIPQLIFKFRPRWFVIPLLLHAYFFTGY